MIREKNIKIRFELQKTRAELDNIKKEHLILKENANDHIISMDRPNVFFFIMWILNC